MPSPVVDFYPGAVRHFALPTHPPDDSLFLFDTIGEHIFESAAILGDVVQLKRIGDFL